MKSKTIKKSILVQLYVTEQMRVELICETLGITSRKLYKVLKQAKINLRNKSAEKIVLVDDTIVGHIDD